MGLYDGRSSVDASYEAFKAEMGVSWDSQVGANDCLYWTGNHIGIGYDSYSSFMWSNHGSGYDDFKVRVVRLDSGDGFTNSGSEDSAITFSGADDWALVEPSVRRRSPRWSPVARRAGLG